MVALLTSTHCASLSSVGGWTCSLADRHCCMITLTDGHPFTAFDAIPIKCKFDLCKKKKSGVILMYSVNFILHK